MTAVASHLRQPVETGPTLRELLDFAQRVAADPQLIARLPLDPGSRTGIRLDGPGGSEVWLIGWPPGSQTGWHDHGGSYGAFVVVAGTLREESLAGELPVDGWISLVLADGVDRALDVPGGRGRVCGRHHIHAVSNPAPHGDSHAISIHACYPPPLQIRHYDRDGRQLRLQRIERAKDRR